MIVAVGTKRIPKIDAVQSVFRQLAQKYPAYQDISLVSRDVASGTRETPVRIQHLMDGASHRVYNLRIQLEEEQIHGDIFIGLEGGVHKLESHAFLQSWVYVESNDYSGYGSSANIPLPRAITRALYEDDRSLGTVIDEFTGKSGVRDNEGTFGILSDMFIQRKQSFETALYAALAPVYNSKIYSLSL